MRHLAGIVLSTCLGISLLSQPSFGQQTPFHEPERGTQERKDLLDALRPIAEWDLGAPIEFVVYDLRIAGDAAFVSVLAQRPGGGHITMRDTPAARRGDLDPEVGDGPTMQSLMVKSGPGWVPVATGIAPTDVWWAWEGFCPIWHAVIPEVCP